MGLIASNRTLRSNGKVLNLNKSSDIVLEFTVKGTYFPVKLQDTANSNANNWLFVSTNSVDNKIFIDFKDGTGEHEYDFRANGNSRQINFRALSGVRDPETIFEESVWNSAGGYFYQDLPEAVRNTVDSSYDHSRKISIRFEKPQNVISFTMSQSRVFEVYSGLSKLRNLTTLNFSGLTSVEFFSQDFYRSFIRLLTLSNIGQVMNIGFPNWIINSLFLETLNVTNSINLSGDPTTKRLSEIDVLKDTLTVLSIAGALIDYPLPLSIGNLTKLTSLDLSSNVSQSLRMPSNLGNIVYLNTLSLRNTRMPFNHLVDTIFSLTNINYIRLSACGYIMDYDLPNDNFSLKRIEIGGSGNSWNNNALPSFLTKLKALEILNINDEGSTAPTGFIRYWIDLTPIAATLNTIYIVRLTDFETTIPDWFDNAVALKTLYIYASFQNTGGADAWINNFYDKVVSVASMSSGNTLLRNMTISQVSATASDNNNTTRPTGTYQQPTGYIQGIDNGTPTSPLEMIWVLVNQYGHTWTLKP